MGGSRAEASAHEHGILLRKHQIAYDAADASATPVDEIKK